ncbi:MAG: endonuclease/exonuclease/phosphatase family protein [Planctomycetota bacterium]
MARRRSYSRSSYGRRSYSRRRRGGIPVYPFVVLALIGVGGYLGCDPNSVSPGSDEPATASSSPQYSSVIPERSASKILVGSFNMQRLGKSKMKDPWVMERLAQVVRSFDVIAIQEINNKEQKAIPTLLTYVNKEGANYAYTISPLLGRSERYLEQYAFVYDTTRVRSGQEYTYTVSDQEDMMHREPFVGRFQAVSKSQPFEFTLVNVHTDPDEVKQELDVLAFVYQQVRQYESPEDDVILLGDLNQAPGKLQQLEQIPSMRSLVGNMPTMTKGEKTNDNILVNAQATLEFTGRSGTFDLEQAFQLSEKDALRLSDHLPVWAEFTLNEQAPNTGQVATGEQALTR